MHLTPGWLEALYVRPEQQNHGAGAALVRHAQERQPDGLELWVFESNDAARAFSARHGFIEAGRTDGAHNEERAPDIRMTWRRS